MDKGSVLSASSDEDEKAVYPNYLNSEIGGGGGHLSSGLSSCDSGDEVLEVVDDRTTHIESDDLSGDNSDDCFVPVEEQPHDTSYSYDPSPNADRHQFDEPSYFDAESLRQMQTETNYYNSREQEDPLAYYGSHSASFQQSEQLESVKEKKKRKHREEVGEEMESKRKHRGEVSEEMESKRKHRGDVGEEMELKRKRGDVGEEMESKRKHRGDVGEEMESKRNNKKSKRKHREISPELGSERELSSSSADKKRPRLQNSLAVPIDRQNKGRQLLDKMGYTEGKGLGKHAQGRVEPVELSKQKGRRGLGMILPGLEDNVTWEPHLEDVKVKEDVFWLNNEDKEILELDAMRHWKVEGPKDLNIEEMTDFIEPNLLKHLLKNKSVFDNLTNDELRRAATRSNPFETIRNGIFLNRAALKMANMDSVFDFMFTEPRYSKGECMLTNRDLLYFADVCAGPGGFSEYILWKKKWRAKGIGFTLKGDCDFKLHDFFSGPPETFEPYYGIHDDGNIYNPENIQSLTNVVMDTTAGHGVHFMMADGGFSVEGQENIQELLSKQLYLCQCLVALSIVRDGGHFVCKLFDIFSPFSAGIIFLMHKAFNRICLFKPNTSRPANSERYIICEGKRPDAGTIRDYMFELNQRLWKLGKNSSLDIVECVPLSLLKDENSEFFNYLYDSNNRLGTRQLVSLKKVAAFYQDSNLIEERQGELRRECLKAWGVPDGARRADRTSEIDTANKILKNVLKPENIKHFLSTKGLRLKSDNLQDAFCSILDWRIVPLGSQEPCFILGLGRSKVYRWNETVGRWDRESRLNLELSPGTLLYGEVVMEYMGQGTSQKRHNGFHIIDGIALNNESIAQHPFLIRREMLTLFTTALKKRDPGNLSPLRVKQPSKMTDLHQVFQRLTMVSMKAGPQELMLDYVDYWLKPRAIAFLKTTKDPWFQHRSKTTDRRYFFNIKTAASKYENDIGHEVDASAVQTLENLRMWLWEDGVGIKQEGPQKGVLHMEELLKFIKKNA